MEAARSRWTDEQIDDFAGRLDRFETRVDQRFDKFEAEVEHRFDKVEAKFDQRLASIESRLDSMNQNMVIAMATIVAAIVAQIVFA